VVRPLSVSIEFGEVEREAVGLPKLHHHGGREAGRLGFGGGGGFIEELQPTIQGAVEEAFLRGERFRDGGLVGAEFRKGVPEILHEHRDELGKKRLLFAEAEVPPETDRTAQNAPEDVVTAFVSGENTIGNRERKGAGCGPR